jgi:YidC/Oxa1 family membrane protein insertase
MDKKSLLGLLLISGLMVAYFIYNQPDPETIRQQREEMARQDSLLRVEAERERFTQDSLNALKKQPGLVIPDTLPAEIRDSLNQIAAASVYGDFFKASAGNEEDLKLENDNLKLFISNKGARIVSAKLKGYKTFSSKYITKDEELLDLIYERQNQFSLSFFHQNRLIRTEDLFFEILDHQAVATHEQPAMAKLRVSAGEGQHIDFEFSLPKDGNMLDMDLRLRNMNEVLDPGTGFIGLDWTKTSPNQELDLENERNRSTIYYRERSGSVSRTGRGGASKEQVDRSLDWISANQQFFSTVLIVPDGLLKPTNAFTSVPEGSENAAMEFSVESSLRFENEPAQHIAMQWYLGPNHYQSLKKLGLGLEEQIDLGYIGIFKWVNTLLIIPVFNFFENMGLGYGIIILLLTLIIKILLSPLNFKTFVSSAKMRVLKPEIDELSAKFKPEEAMKKQQAMMQLYRQAGVNPLAGCIPALLQMPILLAMFSFFPSAIELRQESFLWAKDLSAYDSILDLPFSIPFYGDHVSLFTLLMTVTTIIYTWMSSGQMNTGANAQQMKIMMFLMPIIFLGVLNSYSSALSYYYFLSNVTSILIMIVIRRFFIDENKLRAKIVAYRNDPSKAKKSKWAARLERMQQMREEQVKQQTSPKNRSGRRQK